MTNTMTVKELITILAKHDENETVSLSAWTDHWGDYCGATLSFDEKPYDTIMEYED